MNELIDLDFTLDPTFNIYEASRDLQRARRAEWHEDYTLPTLWKFFEPSKISHGSYWHDWGTEQEIEWKENFRLWMTFINEYKNRGGRVTKSAYLPICTEPILSSIFSASAPFKVADLITSSG